MKLFDLSGRTAVVTGAGKGLGQAMAIALAEAGADVAIVTNSSSAASTAQTIEELGRKAICLSADLQDEAAPAEVVASALDKLGRIDILVNNAGSIRRSPAAQYSREDWDYILDVNLNAVFALCQAAGRSMLEQRSGKIINIASLLSFQGGITVPAYTASKHAVAGLTKALANEWAAHGIQVNAIAPGYIETDNTTALRNDPVRCAQIMDRIPAGRWGKPADMKGAVVFLASDASNYVNGHILGVDGGWMSR